MFMDPRLMLEACHLGATDIVADFGAGSGFVSHAVATLVPNGTVYAIELRRDMVTRVARDAQEHNLKNLHAIWGDIELKNGSTLSDGIADMVIVSNVLFQLDDRGSALAEAGRVLKKGGRLLVIDWADTTGSLGPTAGHVVSKDVAQALAEKNGFTALPDALPVGDHHYAILFKK